MSYAPYHQYSFLVCQWIADTNLDYQMSESRIERFGREYNQFSPFEAERTCRDPYWQARYREMDAELKQWGCSPFHVTDRRRCEYRFWRTNLGCSEFFVQIKPEYLGDFKSWAADKGHDVSRYEEYTGYHLLNWTPGPNSFYRPGDCAAKQAESDLRWGIV